MLFKTVPFINIETAPAYSDEKFSEKEKSVIHNILGEQFEFSLEELDILSQIAHEMGSKFDFYEITVEVNRLLTFNARIKFMECLFEVAVAGDFMSFEELEEIRNITKALKIPHKEFIACKLLYKSKIK